METKEMIEQDIEKEIADMNPIDELCARICVNLGKVIAMLLTNGDTPRLEELKRICIELFDEAEKAKNAARTVH